MKPRSGEEIGKRIKALRLEKGWSYEELAQRAKVTVEDIENIETSFHDDESGLLLKIFIALEVQNPDDILYV